MARRLLVVSTLPWIYPARLLGMLQTAGFIVEAVCPPDHAISKLRRAPVLYPLRPLRETASVAAAIAAGTPDIIVPCDDRATALLHALHRTGDTAVRALIERSLGTPDGYDTVGSKRAVTQLAASLGLPVPASETVSGLGALKKVLQRRRPPVVLKRDRTWGGRGVRIIRRETEARSAWNELSCRNAMPAVRTAWRERSLSPLGELLRLRGATLDVQDFVQGQPANRAIVCDSGKVIAGISVIACETQTETGAASVVRVVEHEQMSKTAAALVAALGISGFCGLDFMICASTGQALLLEINPRATPITHLSVAGSAHLPAAYYTAITGASPRASPQPLTRDTIMLFPNEIARNRNSPYLPTAAHDVPWDEPALLRIVREEMAHAYPPPFTAAGPLREPVSGVSAS